jgi:uncharacterized protein YbjT (DUF2867 family)
MKILVLGATGQIGTTVFQGLSRELDTVGTSRKPPSQALVQFDPFKSSWSKLGKFDILINCIGQIEETKESTFATIHVGLARMIMEKRCEIGNPRVIQISALGADESHRVAFLRTKAIADNLLLTLPGTVIIRPAIICTHRTMIVKKILLLTRVAKFMGGFALVPTDFLATQIQPVMPDDLVKVVRNVCNSSYSKKVINVVGKDKITFAELLRLAFKQQRSLIKVIEVREKWIRFFIKYFVPAICPQLINWQQYQLLFEDNTADSFDMVNLMRGEPQPTLPFFKNEFSYAEN